ncbi:MAG: DUF2911 domain-containing protein [Aestuariibaculum sp.]
MKKTLLILLAITVSTFGFSQIETPQSSPFSKVEQKIGLTDVTLEYSRPSLRGRTFFGNLLPYGKLWRLGANSNTKITFSTDATIGGNTLKAGTYAIFATPNEKSWEVVFYTDTDNWGTPRQWDDSKVAAKVTVEVYPMPVKIETLTMTFDDLTNGSAVLGILWESVYVGVKFEVPTDKLVMEGVSKVMNGPSANDYYAAAVYYSNTGKDIKKAKEWIDKAMSGNDKPAFWQLRQQSLIYANYGDKKGAIKLAKASLAGAEAAGNADYIKMNTASLKEWGGL